MSLSESEILKLIEKAEKARAVSFSPYSHFSVGAAILCRSGEIFTGCNIESEVFSPSICAERTALFKALSEGEKEFLAIAVVGGKSDGGKIQEFCPPCGVCRQILSEFCNEESFTVILYNGKNYRLFKLSDLLPEGFKVRKE